MKQSKAKIAIQPVVRFIKEHGPECHYLKYPERGPHWFVSDYPHAETVGRDKAGRNIKGGHYYFLVVTCASSDCGAQAIVRLSDIERLVEAHDKARSR